MNRGKLRSAWGLALAALFGAAMAQAQPPALPVAAGKPAPDHAQFMGIRTTEYPPTPSASATPANNHAPPAASVDAPRPVAPLGEHGEASHKEDDHNAIVVTGEYLLIRPRRREQDYAIVGTNPNWGPIGTIKNIEGGFDSGFRIAAGWHSCSGFEAVFGYTNFRTEGEDSVTGGRGVSVFPTLTHPSIVTEVTAASAENTINLNLYDLELGRRWKASESCTLRAYIGPRLADLDQEFTATYTGGDVNTAFVRRQLEFTGAGLRVGGEANYQFWEFMGAYVRGSASMLVGQFRSSLYEVANTRTLVNVSEKYDKVVPIMELGVGVSFQKGGWRLTAGYEFVNWFGAVEGIDFADDAHPAKLNRRWADLGFDGFVLRAEYLF